ncbi:Hypothetical predicted protein [Lynx pardinus]|uniref:Uncharacterized protein n=1 Tax=Lynx pardinus TaxID=191816 RepID=A0A485MXB0_LYNPA|nr:Hypothetical predicted protein [Lynx pardinus]
MGSAEAQLAEEQLNRQYRVLLDVKARLEGEITTCWNLLESKDCGWRPWAMSKVREKEEYLWPERF